MGRSNFYYNLTSANDSDEEDFENANQRARCWMMEAPSELGVLYIFYFIAISAEQIIQLRPRSAEIIIIKD